MKYYLTLWSLFLFSFGQNTFAQDYEVLPNIVESTLSEGNENHINYFLLHLKQNQVSTVDTVVSYQTQDDTAIAGQDYIATSGQATIPAGQLSVLIGVEIIADNLEEPDKTFKLSMTPVSGNSAQPIVLLDGFENIATHTIIDDDADNGGNIAVSGSGVDRVLFSDNFDYPDDTVIDTEYSDIWGGRYDDRPNATVKDGRAVLGNWASLDLKQGYKNLRDQWTRISADLYNESNVAYLMTDFYGGVWATFDGKNQLKVQFGNFGFAPQNAYETLVVSPYADNHIRVEMYIKDNLAIVHVVDIDGRQESKLFSSGQLYGDIDYLLGLGYHGSYDNIEIAYIKGTPPSVNEPKRSPLLVTSSLDEGTIGIEYQSIPTNINMANQLFIPVQAYADQGKGKLDYKVTKGILPIGLHLTNEYVSTSNQNSPKRHLARIHGIPTIAGEYDFTLEVTDALGQKHSKDYLIKIKDGNPVAMNQRDEFIGTEGAKVHEAEGSLWDSAEQYTVMFKNNQAYTGSAGELRLKQLLRNDPRQYLHLQMKFYPENAQSYAEMTLLETGGGLFGFQVRYRDGVLTTRSNNLGYSPQANQSEFNIQTNTGDPLIIDIYLKGNQSRIYVKDSIKTQATELVTNSRLSNTEIDYKFSISAENISIDTVILETTDTLPLFYNTLKLTRTDLREGFVGIDYFDQLQAKNGKAPYLWSATSLPDGLSLNENGEITGVASTAGVYPVNLTVTDDLGSSDTLDIDLTIKDGISTDQGTLLFADDFNINVSDKTVSSRDGHHYNAHPDYALQYTDNKLEILPHKQGSLKNTFLNNGTDPLKFSWSMNKGMVSILRENSCYGATIEYDSVQRVKITWGDMCYAPYMEQRDFILETSQEIIQVSVEVKGQEISFEVRDSKQVYQRGKFTLTSREINGHNMGISFRDNTPYGVGLYTSYQSGSMFIDHLRVTNPNTEILSNPLTLKQTEELGEQLFYDPLLSKSNDRSCASCHLPNKGFSDGKKGSMGLDGVQIDRNTPGLTSAALMGSFFHEGRAKSITEQALETIQNPQEMDQNLDNLVAELVDIPEYNQSFTNIWSDGVNATHVANALEAYVKTLLEMRTDFDADLYRQGESMTTDETAGLILFKGKAQCTTCHILEPINNLGDFVYNKPKFEVTGTASRNDPNIATPDIGRMKVTGLETDRGAFRVPPLRDLVRTAPYMHNGVFDTLEEVVKFYNDGGGNGSGLVIPNQSTLLFPLNLSGQEEAQLVAFLKALSPKQPASFNIPRTVPSGLPVGGRFGADEDNDGDGISNKDDNCPMHPNADQAKSVCSVIDILPSLKEGEDVNATHTIVDDD